MDQFMEKLDDGNERIVAILFKLPSFKCVIINCCLPADNNLTLYENNLAIIHEIMCKHRPMANIVLLGDYNVDILNHNRPKEKALIELLKMMQMDITYMGNTYKPTYQHKTKEDHSHRLHFTKLLPNAMCGLLDVLEKNDLNTSTHNTIMACITYSCSMPSKRQDKHVTQGPGTQSQKTLHRYDHHKLDKTVYRDSLSELLVPFKFHLIDPAAAVDILAISTPAKKPRGKWKKKRTLDPVIHEAAEHPKHC